MARVRGVTAAGIGFRVDGVVGRADVHEHRPGPGPLDPAGGRHGGVGDRDDLVPAADPRGPQAQFDGVRPVRHADRVPAAEVVGELGLERLDLRAEDEPAAGEYPLDGGPVAGRVGGEARRKSLNGTASEAIGSSLTPAQWAGMASTAWCTTPPPR